MHSSRFKIPGYQGDVIVHHHGDWSGEAIICFREERLFGKGKEEPEKEVTVPAKLLSALAMPACREMVAQLLVSFAERLPETLGLYEASEAAMATDAKGKKKASYRTTDDKVYGTKFVYCTQHHRVHSTGWCTVTAVDKIALLSETQKEAEEEWDLKSRWLGKR